MESGSSASIRFDRGAGDSLLVRGLKFPLKVLQYILWRAIVFVSETPIRTVVEPFSIVYTRIDPRYHPTALRPVDDYWIVDVRSGGCYRLPSLSNNANNLKSGTVAKIARGTFDDDPMLQRYFLDGFVDLEADDLVVDVGAYVGTFAAYAADDVATIYSLEPDPSNFSCLKANVGDLQNVSIHKLGAWNETGGVAFQARADSSDSAVVKGEGNHSVSATRIDDFAAKHGIDVIDFLKVDVEGLEDRVVEGIGDVAVRKMGIDCGEGEGNGERVRAILHEKGYDVETRGHLVYARSSRQEDVP